MPSANFYFLNGKSDSRRHIVRFALTGTPAAASCKTARLILLFCRIYDTSITGVVYKTRHHPIVRSVMTSRTILFILIFPLLALVYSCTTTAVPDTPQAQAATAIETAKPPVPETQELLLTFAGDIMAHSVNFQMDDYSLIYADIADILHSDDLSFANMETPVHTERPYESYPTFNVQAPYAAAAIEAGFDVFSLANNHSNDQDAQGIDSTARFFASQPVYAAGIRSTNESGLSYQLIEKDGWTILFAAVTEILNSTHDIERLDYIPPTQESRERFRAELAALRAAHPCDLFILSLHTNEAEYVPDIQPERRQYYYSLLDSGVDIVWANHPHIAKEWEVVADAQTGTPNKLVMYALGNTISGQRTKPNFQNPAASRDYTGDGYLIQARFIKRAASFEHGLAELPPMLVQTEPILITTYITPERHYVIRKLNEAFIAELYDEQLAEYAQYFSARMKLMHNIGEKHICR